MKTEIVRAEGLWADGSMGGLKDFSMVVFGGETIGITGLVDSGIASVSGILSGRSRIEKGTLYIHNEPAELKYCPGPSERYLYHRRPPDFTEELESGGKYMHWREKPPFWP